MLIKKHQNSLFLKNAFKNEFLKDMEMYQTKPNWMVRGTLNTLSLRLNAIIHSSINTKVKITNSLPFRTNRTKTYSQQWITQPSLHKLNDATTLVSASVNLLKHTFSWLAQNSHTINLTSLFIGRLLLTSLRTVSYTFERQHLIKIINIFLTFCQ